MRIGVLAVQGGVREHAETLNALGVDVIEVRDPDDLTKLDGLVIPGGESTAIGKAIRRSGLEEGLRAFDRPMFGTCAGLNLLAADAEDGAADQLFLGAIDITVRRNGYGSQARSFEAAVRLADGAPGGPGEGGAEAADGVVRDKDFRGVFIRAPRVVRCGPGVEVLAELDGAPVLVRERDVLAAAFHPELAGDARIHRLFLSF